MNWTCETVWSLNVSVPADFAVMPELLDDRLIKAGVGWFWERAELVPH